MGVKEDRRLNPFLPGSRASSVGYQDGTILPKPGGEVFAKNRQDWVAFQLGSGEGQALAQAELETEEVTPPVRRDNTGTLSPAPDQLASGTPKNTAPQAQAAEQKYTPPAATPRYTPATVPPRYTGSAVRDYRTNAQGVQPAVKKSIEERLVILNNLRSKRLITEDEYRDKRMEILSEL
jgi:hypothetical protein